MERIELTPKQKKAVQFLATTSNVLLHRNKIGVSSDKLKKTLGIKSDAELNTIIEICNMSLSEEVIPAKIIYDDVLDVYVYLQSADPSVVIERINSKSMLLFMLLYYNQQVLNKGFTHSSELQDIVDATVTENSTSKIRSSIDPLIQYCLVVETDFGYKVTRTGEAFLTPVLLNRITNVVMGKNYSISAVLEFYRQNVTPRVEPTAGEDYKLGLL